ncbi:DNA-processing protein DprA [Candidatus Sulfidibacterium hydrothermale]|uniref:DNA-processing protein DprA n=1 Tax=Candidatus Sulfidibacterium hydrothermale TaxID=2875962 RepID=UPI001F0A0E23|nr:DNA-processing protein DprA [Candidatus Sulfidibacterium hydrothermale]UBM62405.1 DNA-processing protein DprA [Candidatus Sulfidibacterium hydrothermale]
METRLLYQIGITLIPGIGDVNGKKLVHWFGSAEAVFKAKEKDLLMIPGIGRKMVQNILHQKVLRRAEKEVRYIEKNQIRPLFFLDDDFPQRLLNCYDHPLMLYYKGKADLNHKRMIAFVGTRRATGYGKEQCRQLIDGLREKDVLIVSGLAYGIDGCAHRHAVDLDISTVAVLGHGLDRIYPASHRKLAEEMLISGGGLLTEFLSETVPDRENFPRRNRIVAGMVDAVVVVESGMKGGALITAELANSYNRDVFAVPGRVTDPFSSGCNQLIKTNRAALVHDAGDIGYLMGWEDRKKKTVKQINLFPEMNEREKAIYDLLCENGIMGIDKVIVETGFSPSSVSTALLNLEFNGLVRSLPGKQYQAE